MTLLNGLAEKITILRNNKQFNPKDYINTKAKLLNQYMQKFGLKSCVIGVSGGIDSGTVLGLVKYASCLENSPIEKIIPICLPVFNSGATGQMDATNRGSEVATQMDLKPIIVDITNIQQAIQSLFDSELNITSSDWAKGQLVAHTRTPALYYTATLLTQEGLPAIIVGTTNRDEGLYLGYFGKASDGLVDIQLISDLHKSEVYAVAKELNITDSVLKAIPQGDMYDGRIDEEVFGAPYDFVELYLNYLTLNNKKQIDFINTLNKKEQEQFKIFQNNLEKLHNYNSHKYISASPAVHLDIDSELFNIKNSWKTNCNFQLFPDKPTDINSFNNLIHIKEPFPNSLSNSRNVISTKYNIYDSDVIYLENILSHSEIDWILNQVNNQNWKPTNKYGNMKDFNPAIDIPQSLRISVYNEELAELIMNRINPHIPYLKSFPNTLPIISNNKDVWVKKTINPLFRFIRYNGNNELISHYDDTYEYNEYKKTLLTMVIYLENSDSETRFLKDNQYNIPDKDRIYKDSETIGKNDDVLLSFKSTKGNALIFNHRLLHDATQPKNNQKTIIRTDIVFQSPNFGFNL